MKPTQFNPSPLEVEFANAISDFKEQLVQKLTNMHLENIETHLNKDNPHVLFMLKETDGTRHEILIKCIQRVLD